MNRLKKKKEATNVNRLCFIMLLSSPVLTGHSEDELSLLIQLVIFQWVHFGLYGPGWIRCAWPCLLA